MTHTELCQRTKSFAIAVARLGRTLGGDVASRHGAGQVTRAAAAVAANYRAAGLARSRREFIAKIGLVIEEADECVFWLEYVQGLHASALTTSGLADLMDESRQLVRIFTAARNTARRNASGHRDIGASGHRDMERSDDPMPR